MSHFQEKNAPKPNTIQKGLKKMKIYNEQTLIKYIKKPKNTFPYSVDGFDVPIKGFFSNKNIGNVDMVINRNRRKYFIEIKINKNFNIGDFWSSLKVLGYVAAEKIYHPYENVIPCILIRKELITNDIIAILGKLKIVYITVDLIGNNPKFECYL